jgi:hypothetical protein
LFIGSSDRIFIISWIKRYCQAWAD